MNSTEFKKALLQSNTKEINCSFKLIPKRSKSKNKKKSSRSNSLFFYNASKSKERGERGERGEREEERESKREHSINRIHSYELPRNNYIDNVLKIKKYIKLPKGINNDADKNKWKEAQSLRYRMKMYDAMTRNKLKQSSIINNKAKYNRERYIILNKIPLYREAFPSTVKTPSNKNKKDIIRNYLKMHASYLISEIQEGIKNNHSNEHINYSTTPNKYQDYTSDNYKSKDLDNSSTFSKKSCYSCDSYNTHTSCPHTPPYRQSYSTRYPQTHKSDFGLYTISNNDNIKDAQTKQNKKDLSYNLWKKKIIDDIKNGNINTSDSQCLKKHGFKKFYLQNENRKTTNVNKDNIYCDNILVNGTQNSIQKSSNSYNRIYGKKSFNSKVSNCNLKLNVKETIPLSSKIKSSNKIKKKDPYKRNTSKSNINYNTYSDSTYNSSTYDHLDACTDITHNIVRNSHIKKAVNNNYEYVNSTYSSGTYNSDNYNNGSYNSSHDYNSNKTTNAYRPNLNNYHSLNKQQSLISENSAYKKKRFSIMGKIKKNNNIELNLVLNKV
ncbi:conserved protein, unknown function [Hepatocystis sp. ex Piliocolobus tephrosceles]|nr:conserved protein, unknown function [Hepatocystis sp. ex Piliocolobus tephrosceles]